MTQFLMPGPCALGWIRACLVLAHRGTWGHFPECHTQRGPHTEATQTTVSVGRQPRRGKSQFLLPGPCTLVWIQACPAGAHSSTQEPPLGRWVQEACTLERCDCGVQRSVAVEWEDSVFDAGALHLGWIYMHPAMAHRDCLPEQFTQRGPHTETMWPAVSVCRQPIRG